MTIIVKALPWHSNAPRDGTWWIGYEQQRNGFGEDDGHVVAHATDPVNPYRGTSHAEAVAALEAHIADARVALTRLQQHLPTGEFSE